MVEDMKALFLLAGLLHNDGDSLALQLLKLVVVAWELPVPRHSPLASS